MSLYLRWKEKVVIYKWNKLKHSFKQFNTQNGVQSYSVIL